MKEQKIAVVVGNPRSDIAKIYNEVRSVSNRFGVKVVNFVTSKILFESRKKELFFELLLSALSPRQFMGSILDRNIYQLVLNGRIWSLFDYLRFKRLAKNNNIDFLFCLNAKHSRGALKYASGKGIIWISHQHGDYYSDKNHVKDVEGGGVRLFWNQVSLNNFLKNFGRTDAYVSGSLKHINMYEMYKKIDRKVSEPKTLAFLDTIYCQAHCEVQSAYLVVDIAKKLEEEFDITVGVKIHPQRLNNRDRDCIDVESIYSQNSIPVWNSFIEEYDAVFTLNSNAIYDSVAMGVPSIYCDWKFSNLSLTKEFPGYLEAGSPDFYRDLSWCFSSIWESGFSMRQIDYCQNHIFGCKESLYEAFGAIFERRM